MCWNMKILLGVVILLATPSNSQQQQHQHQHDQHHQQQQHQPQHEQPQITMVVNITQEDKLNIELANRVGVRHLAVSYPEGINCTLKKTRTSKMVTKCENITVPECNTVHKVKLNNVTEDCSRQREYCQYNFRTQELTKQNIICERDLKQICTGSCTDASCQTYCERNPIVVCSTEHQMVVVTEKRQRCGETKELVTTKICFTYPDASWTCRELRTTEDCERESVRAVANELGVPKINCIEKEQDPVCLPGNCRLASNDTHCLTTDLPVQVELEDFVCEECSQGRTKLRPVLVQVENCDNEKATEFCVETEEYDDKWTKTCTVSNTMQPKVLRNILLDQPRDENNEIQDRNDEHRKKVKQSRLVRLNLPENLRNINDNKIQNDVESHVQISDPVTRENDKLQKKEILSGHENRLESNKKNKEKLVEEQTTENIYEQQNREKNNEQQNRVRLPFINTLNLPGRLIQERKQQVEVGQNIKPDDIKQHHQNPPPARQLLRNRCGSHRGFSLLGLVSCLKQNKNEPISRTPHQQPNSRTRTSHQQPISRAPHQKPISRTRTSLQQSNSRTSFQQPNARTSQQFSTSKMSQQSSTSRTSHQQPNSRRSQQQPISRISQQQSNSRNSQQQLNSRTFQESSTSRTSQQYSTSRTSQQQSNYRTSQQSSNSRTSQQQSISKSRTSQQSSTSRSSQQQPTSRTSQQQPLTSRTFQQQPTSTSRSSQLTSRTSQQQPTFRTSQQQPTSNTSQQQPLTSRTFQQQHTSTSRTYQQSSLHSSGVGPHQSTTYSPEPSSQDLYGSSKGFQSTSKSSGGSQASSSARSLKDSPSIRGLSRPSHKRTVGLKSPSNAGHLRSVAQKNNGNTEVDGFVVSAAATTSNTNSQRNVVKPTGSLENITPAITTPPSSTGTISFQVPAATKRILNNQRNNNRNVRIISAKSGLVPNVKSKEQVKPSDNREAGSPLGIQSKENTLKRNNILKSNVLRSQTSSKQAVVRVASVDKAQRNLNKKSKILHRIQNTKDEHSGKHQEILINKPKNINDATSKKEPVMDDELNMEPINNFESNTKIIKQELQLNSNKNKVNLAEIQTNSFDVNKNLRILRPKLVQRNKIQQETTQINQRKFEPIKSSCRFPFRCYGEIEANPIILPGRVQSNQNNLKSNQSNPRSKVNSSQDKKMLEKNLGTKPIGSQLNQNQNEFIFDISAKNPENNLNRTIIKVNRSGLVKNSDKSAKELEETKMTMEEAASLLSQNQTQKRQELHAQSQTPMKIERKSTNDQDIPIKEIPRNFKHPDSTKKEHKIELPKNRNSIGDIRVASREEIEKLKIASREQTVTNKKTEMLNANEDAVNRTPKLIKTDTPKVNEAENKAINKDDGTAVKSDNTSVESDSRETVKCDDCNCIEDTREKITCKVIKCFTNSQLCFS